MFLHPNKLGSWLSSSFLISLHIYLGLLPSFIQMHVKVHLENSIHSCCGIKGFFGRLLKWLMCLISTQNETSSDASSHSVKGPPSFIYEAESHWMKLTVSLSVGELIQHVLKGNNVLSHVVFRLIGGAKTSLCCHGELGAECLCGAKDPVGCRGVVIVLSNGAHHGGRPRDLPSGRRRHYFFRQAAQLTILHPLAKSIYYRIYCC